MVQNDSLMISAFHLIPRIHTHENGDYKLAGERLRLMGEERLEFFANHTRAEPQVSETTVIQTGATVVSSNDGATLLSTTGGTSTSSADSYATYILGGVGFIALSLLLSWKQR